MRGICGIIIEWVVVGDVMNIVSTHHIVWTKEAETISIGVTRTTISGRSTGQTLHTISYFVVLGKIVPNIQFDTTMLVCTIHNESAQCGIATQSNCI